MTLRSHSRGPWQREHWGWLRDGRARNDKGPRLLAEAKPGDEFAVAVHVAVIQIPQLAATLANKHQQPATGMIIVLVRLQVGRQVLDTFRQDRYLDFRGPGVADVRGVFLDQVRFALLGQQPSRAFPLPSVSTMSG